MEQTVARPGAADSATTDIHESEEARPVGGFAVTGILVFGVIALGFVVRFMPMLSGGFPPNDGGMFASIVDDIVANNFAIPETTSYNGGEIAFAYPLLPFYVAALFTLIPGVGAATALQILPLIMSTVSVYAAYRLGRRLLGRRDAGLVMAAGIALTPAAFAWHVMGGGLTRSFGFCFALLALGSIHDVIHKAHPRAVPLAGLFAGLAVMSHLEAAVVVLVSAVVLLAFSDNRSLDALKRLSVGAAVGVAVASPWLLSIVVQGKIEALRAASSTGFWALWIVPQALLWQTGRNPIVDIIPVLGVLGLAVTLWRRDRMWLVWIFAIWFFDPRSGSEYSMVPWTALAAIAAVEVLPRAYASLAADEPSEGRKSIGGVSFGVLGAYLFLGAIAMGAIQTTRGPSVNVALSAHERTAMAEIAATTPDDANFLIVTDESGWGTARVHEWFPHLAQRVSLNTVQATEWEPDDGFARALTRFKAGQACADLGLSCVADWTERWQQPDYVYVSSEQSGRFATTEACCPILSGELERSADYEIVYSTDGIQLFEYVG